MKYSERKTKSGQQEGQCSWVTLALFSTQLCAELILGLHKYKEKLYKDAWAPNPKCIIFLLELWIFVISITLHFFCFTGNQLLFREQGWVISSTVKFMSARSFNYCKGGLFSRQPGLGHTFVIQIFYYFVLRFIV